MSGKRVLISGSAALGGLASSYRRAFESIGWNVGLFDDEAAFTARMGINGNRVMRRLLWRLWARRPQRDFVENIRITQPDLVLVLKGFFYSPNTIIAAKSVSPLSVLAHFNPDNSFNRLHFGNSNGWIRQSILLYDIHLTWGKFLVTQLRTLGARCVHFLPFAYDPWLHHPTCVSPQELASLGADVAFVGSWDDEREKILSELLDFDLKIWGNSWEKAAARVRAKWQGCAVLADQFAKVCGASRINLNIIRKQNGPAHNMRTFEIPACGGFMLSTRTSEQEEILREGHEIACFGRRDELRLAIPAFLAMPEARAKMVAAATKRLTHNHSYIERALELEDIHHSVAVKTLGCVS